MFCKYRKYEDFQGKGLHLKKNYECVIKQIWAELDGKVFKPKKVGLKLPPLTEDEIARKSQFIDLQRNIVLFGSHFLDLEVERAISSLRKFPDNHQKTDILTVTFLKQFYQDRLQD